MRGSSGDSSDLMIARQLSRRLATGAAGDVPEGGYVRFRQGPAPVAAPGAVAAPVGDERFTAWDELLGWSCLRTGASAAFVVDPQGFVIASQGDVPDDGFEGAGAELSYLMGQADSMNPDAGPLRAVRLDFPGQSLIGLRTEAEETAGFVLAFVDAGGLTPALAAGILRVLEGSLPELA